MDLMTAYTAIPMTILCLWNIFLNPRAIQKPDILKKALGLQRADPVPVSCIEIVERLARTIAINITGDITRISSNPAHKQITLILANGHYSIMSNPDRRKLILLLLSQRFLLFIRRMG